MGTTTNVSDGLVQNRLGLSAEHLQMLWEDLKPLGEVDSRLAEQAMRYAVDGDEGEVLVRLAGMSGCGKALKVYGCEGQGYTRVAHSKRRALLEANPSDDPLFYVRLAEVYRAAATRDQAGANILARSVVAMAGVPELFRVLVLEVVDSGFYGSERGPASNFAANLAERIVVAAGGEADALVRTVVQSQLNRYFAEPVVGLITSLKGFGGLLTKHAAVVLEGLRDREADRRAHVLELLAKHNAEVGPFAEQVTDLAVGTAKGVREAAELLVKTHMQVFAPLLQKKAETGNNDERLLAVKALWSYCGESVRPLLKARMEQDKAPKVRAAIAELLQEQQEIAGQPEQPLELPPVERPAEVIRLSEEMRQAVTECVRKDYESLQRHHQQHPNFQLPNPPTDDDIAEIVRYLEEGKATAAVSRYVRDGWWQKTITQLVGRPEFHLLHSIRLLRMVHHSHEPAQIFQLQPAILCYLQADPQRTLRDVAAALEVAGRLATTLGEVLFSGYGSENTPLLRLRPDAIWPYFAEHPEILEQAWQKKEGFDYWHDARRRRVFKVLATFPQLPQNYVRMLWDIAFNGSKKERPLAQKALASVAGKEQRILVSLTAGKAEHRAVAAEWIGEIGYAQAVPELRKALKKEKNDLAAGAMMVALEKLGVPLDEFVSMEGLLKEAQTLLGKGIPKELAWFKFESLPKVRWAKDDQAVRPEVLQWMILQSFKLGSPDPSPRLRQYVSYMNRTDAEEFGQHILQAWMAKDLMPPSHEDAEAYARQHAAQMASMLQQYPQHAQYYQPPAQGWHQKFYQDKINQPIGSATKEKGILAVAAACCGGRAAAPIQRYLKTWYGMRVHQCKALLAVLSWVDHPAAIQVLLAVAARFRTAGIRQEAERIVNEVAERKGWTLDELADRTIPTAGFDEKREMVIDYGTRKFVAKVDNDLEISLTNEEGKTVKSLPDPRQDEDAEKIKTLKKEFSAAKKELQGVVKLQRERLYEAMCTQRSWSFAEWNTLLASHPIVGSYCQRLIWAVRERDQVTKTLRPMGDGTFTDAADEPVELKAEDRICLAHQCLLPDDAAAAWQQHFADYEVQPLFQQLGQATFSLAEADRRETKVTAFKGHMLDAFKLRSVLTKRGYTRGQAQDGGWFYEYHKLFPGQGLRATIEFSGNGLPEENRKVALVNLHFSRTSGGDDEVSYWSSHSGLPLSEVPAVLLSECYNDLRTAAGEGTGFDAEWEKKVY